jgi:hypothetical protein
MSTVTGLSKPSNETSGLTRRFYLTAWRWHFYAGLYVAPFLIMLAITGTARMHSRSRPASRWPLCRSRRAPPSSPYPGR